MAPFAAQLGLHVGKVTGPDAPKTTLKKSYDFQSVLTLFSPRSKEKSIVLPNEPGELDILIGTDCISEGQNLQDCDFLINYDIHWNPVRIIQRFGRIDRIGSADAPVFVLTEDGLTEHSRAEITRWIRATCARWRELNDAYETARAALDDPDANEQARSRAAGRMNGRLGDMRRYLDRFLVEALSRAAVIPAYSFPVHSIHLEIVTERGACTASDDRAFAARSRRSNGDR